MKTDAKAQTPEFPLFDWLRIAMATLVTAWHFSLIPWNQAGNLGVQVFFALSGWLIGSILIEMPREAVPKFYYNRVTRVWAPYFFAIVLIYGLSAALEPITGRWLEFLFYDVTFTHNFFSLLPNAQDAFQVMPLKGTGNHFWSLAVEEQFYLIAPLMILFLPWGRHPLTWIVSALFLIVVRQEFSAICLGVSAAAMHHMRPGFQKGFWVRTVLVAAAVGSSACVVAPNLYYTAVPVFAISVVLLLAIPGARSGIGRFLGGISYPMYLNHWIALVGVSSASKRLGGNTLIWAGFGMIVALAIGAVCYMLVDRQVLARRSRWYRPGLGTAAATLSYLLVGVGLTVGVVRKLL